MQSGGSQANIGDMLQSSESLGTSLLLTPFLIWRRFWDPESRCRRREEVGPSAIDWGKIGRHRRPCSATRTYHHQLESNYGVWKREDGPIRMDKSNQIWVQFSLLWRRIEMCDRSRRCQNQARRRFRPGLEVIRRSLVVVTHRRIWKGRIATKKIRGTCFTRAGSLDCPP